MEPADAGKLKAASNRFIHKTSFDILNIQSSYITLRNMRFHARHGVMPQERVTGGDYEVTVRVKYDIGRAAMTDSVDDTLNYAQLYELVKREMLQPSALLEHVAGRIGNSILTTFHKVEAAEVTIVKLNPPMGADCDGAAVEMIMTRETVVPE